MNELLTMAGAAEYLQNEYGVEASTSAISNWIKRGHLEGQKGSKLWFTTQEALDKAMGDTIPPKAGRKRAFTKEQREKMVRMYGKHSLKEIAKYFCCSESYVSLVVRGMR